MRSYIWHAFLAILCDPATALLRVVYYLCIFGLYASFYPADPLVTWTHDAMLSTCAVVTSCSVAVEHNTGWDLPAWTKQATPQALAKEKPNRGARIAEMHRYSPQARHLMFLAMLTLFRWLWPVVAFAVLWWIKFTVVSFVWG